MKDDRTRVFRDAHQDIESTQGLRETAQTRSTAYRLAFDDPEFLSEPIVRSVSFKKLPDSYADQFFFEYECEVVEWESGAPGRSE